MNIKDKFKHVISDFLVNIECTDNDIYNLEMKKNGCLVIKNFIDKELCDSLVLDGKKIINNRNDAVSIESNGADLRVYGVNKIENKFELKIEADKLNAFAKKFYKKNEISYFQMLGNINYMENNTGSGGGWHRDSPFSHQFKFILYLSDVNENNGPFQYLVGSHRTDSIFEYSKRCGIKLGQYRFTDKQFNEIASDKYQIKTVCGAAGDLLIADVKGLHRGKPLVEGERWATTRYYFRNEVPEEFNRLIS